MKTLAILISLLIAILADASAQPTWQACNGPYAGQVNALAVNHAGDIFAGTTYGGVFKSTDNGQSWNQINAGLTDTRINCLAFFANSHVFAGTWSQGIFRSTDDGQSWMAMNTGLTDLSPPGIRGIDFSPTGIVFAAGSRGMFRSTDEGMSWRTANKGIIYVEMTSLVVEPRSGYVFAAGVEPPGGTLYRSANNGDSWTQLSAHTSGGIIKALTVSQDGHIFFCVGQTPFVRWTTDLGDTYAVHWMGSDNIHPQTLLARERIGILTGTDGYGIYQSTDHGTTWSPINNGLRHTWIYSLASNSEGIVFAGTDSDGVYRTVSPVTSVREGFTPTDFRLGQNYPNPFNPSTAISFRLPAAGHVSLKIFSILGQEVATLLNEVCAAGTRTVQWNANDSPSGIYFYRLQAADYLETKKMILLR
jgi:photosystem II stability/assembly factor-like uncharacterized protein